MDASNKLQAGENQTRKGKKIRWFIISLIICLLLAASAYASYRSYYQVSGIKDNKAGSPPTTQPPTENPDTKTPDTKSKPKTDGSGDAKKPPEQPKPAPSPTPTPAPAPTPNPAPTPTISFLDFYLDIANSNIGDFQARNTRRWSRSTVYVAGRPGIILPQYNECLNMFVADFNNNSNGVTLVNNANQPEIQIRIEMVTMQELLQMNGNYLPFTHSENDTKGNMTSALIYLPNNSDWGNEEKCWSLKHEMMHAIGFMGHSNRLGESEMGNPIMMYWGGLKPNDQRAIRMLYQSGVPVNSSRDEARTYFSVHAY